MSEAQGLLMVLICTSLSEVTESGKLSTGSPRTQRSNGSGNNNGRDDDNDDDNIITANRTTTSNISTNILLLQLQ